MVRSCNIVGCFMFKAPWPWCVDHMLKIFIASPTHNGKKSFKTFLDSDGVMGPYQNLIICSLSHGQQFLKPVKSIY